MKVLLYLSHCKCAFIAGLVEAIRLWSGYADNGVWVICPGDSVQGCVGHERLYKGVVAEL